MSWDLPSPFVHERTVVHGEIDGYGHVNNVVYIAWMDDCAWEHSKERGIPFELCKQLGRGMAVWRTQVNYLGAAYLGDRVQVATWPVLNDGRLRIARRFQIRRESDGATLVRALVHYVCIDLESGRAKRMPTEFTKYTVAPEVAAALALETEPYQPGVEPG